MLKGLAKYVGIGAACLALGGCGDTIESYSVNKEGVQMIEDQSTKEGPNGLEKALTKHGFQDISCTNTNNPSLIEIYSNYQASLEVKAEKILKKEYYLKDITRWETHRKEDPNKGKNFGKFNSEDYAISEIEPSTFLDAKGMMKTFWHLKGGDFLTVDNSKLYFLFNEILDEPLNLSGTINKRNRTADASFNAYMISPKDDSRRLVGFEITSDSRFLKRFEEAQFSIKESSKELLKYESDWVDEGGIYRKSFVVVPSFVNSFSRGRPVEKLNFISGSLPDKPLEDVWFSLGDLNWEELEGLIQNPERFIGKPRKLYNELCEIHKITHMLHLKD